ncbi:MAG: helix-turn-helix domain-containing protein [Solirubrobacterales bacterium]
MTAKLDTSYHKRRLAQELKDPEFRAEYKRARRQIAQVDAVMRQLDELREDVGFSKAELARRIGKTPSTVRRLFTAEVNPELKTVAAIANELGAEVRVVSKATGSRRGAQKGRGKQTRKRKVAA